MAEESGSGSEVRSGVLQQQTEELEKAREAEEDARRKQAEREETLEAHKNAMIDAINRRTAALNDQTRLKTMLATMEERLQEVTVSCEAMKRAGTDLDDAVREAREHLQAEQEKRQELDQLVQEAREQLEAADASVIQARKDYDGKLAEMRDMESRQKLLDEMSRELEGYANSVRSVVRYARERGMDKVYGPLNRLMSVPREYETAMDMVLGNAQQNIVTEDEETAKALIEFLRSN